MIAPGEQPGRISTAIALLGKAESSPFVGERESLALRAYREIAAYLNGLDPQDGSERRRERRLLVDRRSSGRRPGGPSSARPSGADEATPSMDTVKRAYRQSVEAYRQSLQDRSGPGAAVPPGPGGQPGPGRRFDILI